MPLQIPVRVQELVTEVTETLSHTRGVTQAEVLRALSFGHAKIARALKAVHAQQFTAFVDPFTLPANQREVDLSGLDPAAARPVKLLVGVDGTGVARRAILFRPRGMMAPEFEMAEQSRAGTFSVILYDIIRGFAPQAYVGVTAALSETEITVEDASSFEVGALVQATGLGAPQTVTALATVPNDYLGTVVGITGNDLTIAPPMTAVASPGLTQVRRIRTMVMLLANPPVETLTGRLAYQYELGRLTNVDQLLTPNIAPYRDPIVYYALSQLLQATNETDAARWFQQAEEMKAEVFQDADPMSLQGAQGASSALHGIGE